MSTPAASLVAPDGAGEPLLAAVNRVFRAVVALGGAVGYLEPPARPVTDAWVAEVLADARRGDGALVVVADPAPDGVLALGSWRRGSSAVTRASGSVHRVMVHPEERGRGLGRAVMTSLIEDAARGGVEVLSLGVRGNNHGARALYSSLGFRVWGVLPNALQVGAERFDDVRMVLELPRPPGVVLRGSAPYGPGSSLARD